MGFVRKVVGSITGANQAAKATENAARVQAEATRAAADQAAVATREAAAQSARQQELTVARLAATQTASEQAATPMENPEVSLSTPAPESASGAARKRRAAFGLGSASTGVQI